jgi:UDP-N-acetylglucosamine 4,6-dehydratase
LLNSIRERYGQQGLCHSFILEQAKAGKPLTVTNPEMTRFVMSLEEAVDLVLYAFKNGTQGDLFVQKAPAIKIGDLAKAVIEVAHSKSSIEYIGIRHGEKCYETLVTSEEMARAEDCGSFYRIAADDRDLNYENYMEKGNEKIADFASLTSKSVKLLTVAEMMAKLKDLKMDGDNL